METMMETGRKRYVGCVRWVTETGKGHPLVRSPARQPLYFTLRSAGSNTVNYRLFGKLSVHFQEPLASYRHLTSLCIKVPMLPLRSPYTDSDDIILFIPLSYPLCDVIASSVIDSIVHPPPVPLLTHSPNASPGHSTSGRSTVSYSRNQTPSQGLLCYLI